MIEIKDHYSVFLLLSKGYYELEWAKNTFVKNLKYFVDWEYSGGNEGILLSEQAEYTLQQFSLDYLH
jgi:hypothetical protein